MIRPLYDRVLIEPRKPDEKIGNIILPERAQRQMDEGVVVAVGEGKFSERNGTHLKMKVKVGDRVLYNWGGSDIELDKKKYRILLEGDILAIMD